MGTKTCALQYFLFFCDMMCFVKHVITDTLAKGLFSFLNSCQVSEKEKYKFTSIFLLKILCNFIFITIKYEHILTKVVQK